MALPVYARVRRRTRVGPRLQCRAEASPSLADGAGLEYRFAGNRIEGSNPSASADRTCFYVRGLHGACSHSKLRPKLNGEILEVAGDEVEPLRSGIRLERR